MNTADHELAAIESVSARATALTRWASAVILIPGVLVIFPLYFVAREIQFAAIGVNITYVSAAVAVAHGSRHRVTTRSTTTVPSSAPDV